MPRRFKTTEAHFEAFSQQQRLRFEDEMLARLRREYGHVLGRRDDAWVRELIQVGTDDAAEYGIVLERDVARYISFTVEISPDFDESEETPWAKEILTCGMMTAQAKLDRIGEHVVDEEESDLEPFPLMSRPGAEVGNSVIDPQTSGELVISLVDAQGQEPIPGASVQVTGPVIERAVADDCGTVRFEGIALGEYEILAVDRQHRLGEGKVTVEPGGTRKTLTCRRVGQSVTGG